MANYDWLQLGTHEPHDAIIGLLSHSFDLADIRSVTPRNGYTDAVDFVRGECRLASVQWGNNDGISAQILATGERAKELHPMVYPFLRDSRSHFWAQRIDACEDFSQAGLFDDMAAKAIEFAQLRNLKINQKGDWTRGKARTLYIGSRTSEVHVRIYEKGQQVGTDPNWVRYESEIKPSSRNPARRHLIAKMTPGQLLFHGMSGKLLNHLGWDHLEPLALPSVYTPTDDERSRRALLKQYGNVISKWAEEVGGYHELSRVLEREIA